LFRGEGDLASAPAVELPRSAFAEGVSVVDLVVTVGLYPSKREARRQIAEGGLTVDGTRVASVDDRVTGETLNGREALLLRAGKKRFLQVRLIG
jgi:tyrosyl-tRNA synthetase